MRMRMLAVGGELSGGEEASYIARSNSKIEGLFEVGGGNAVD